VNQNPLGSAAGFGINHLELDRKKTTELLNFDRCQENVMYCGFSRGYFEMMVLQALNVPMVIASRFATDMMMFTQQETSFFSLPDQFVTGSSIMPQKKNYDLFEIMRANGKVFASLQTQIQSTIVGLGSGYHRDFQVTKKAFVEAVDLAMQTLSLLEACLPELKVNQELLKAAMTKELFVTDEVYKRVAGGELFRDAYLTVKQEFHSKMAGS
jgi:argininosuccinate lyase